MAECDLTAVDEIRGTAKTDITYAGHAREKKINPELFVSLKYSANLYARTWK